MTRSMMGFSVDELALHADVAAVCHELGFRKTRKAHKLAASLGCDVKTGEPTKHRRAPAQLDDAAIATLEAALPDPERHDMAEAQAHIAADVAEAIDDFEASIPDEVDAAYVASQDAEPAELLFSSGDEVEQSPFGVCDPVL